MGLDPLILDEALRQARTIPRSRIAARMVNKAATIDVTNTLWSAPADLLAHDVFFIGTGRKMKIRVPLGVIQVDNGSSTVFPHDMIVRLYKVNTDQSLTEVKREQFTALVTTHRSKLMLEVVVPTTESAIENYKVMAGTNPNNGYGTTPNFHIVISDVNSSIIEVEEISPVAVRPVSADDGFGWLGDYGISRAVSSEGDLFLCPVDFKADGTKKPVIFAHGYNQVTSDLVGSQWRMGTNSKGNGQGRILRMLAQFGPVVVGDLGGVSTWGNATARTRMGQMLTWAGTLGCDVSQFFGFGVSMGNMSIGDYAAANVGKCAAWASSSGIADLEWTYANDASHQAAIGTAWSKVYPAALPADATLLGNCTAIGSGAGANKVPYRSYYNSDDPYINPAGMATFVTQMGGTGIVVGTGGHNTIDTMDLREVVTFFRTYGF